MRGSFGRVVEALLSRVASRGGELRPSRPVKVASRSDGRWLVDFRGGSETFDLVLSTVAIPELLRIAPDLPAETRARWEHDLLRPRPLPRPRRRPPADALLLDERRRRHDAVRRIHRAHELRPRVAGTAATTSSTCRTTSFPTIPSGPCPTATSGRSTSRPSRASLPEIDRARILERHLFRAEYAQPIVGTHYSRVLPPVRTGVPGLYSAAMAQVYPEDRGQNYAVKIARNAAAALLEDLS